MSQSKVHESEAALPSLSSLARYSSARDLFDSQKQLSRKPEGSVHPSPRRFSTPNASSHGLVGVPSRLKKRDDSVTTLHKLPDKGREADPGRDQRRFSESVVSRAPSSGSPPSRVGSLRDLLVDTRVDHARTRARSRLSDEGDELAMSWPMAQEQSAPIRMPRSRSMDVSAGIDAVDHAWEVKESASGKDVREIGDRDLENRALIGQNKLLVDDNRTLQDSLLALRMDNTRLLEHLHDVSAQNRSLADEMRTLTDSSAALASLSEQNRALIEQNATLAAQKRQAESALIDAERRIAGLEASMRHESESAAKRMEALVAKSMEMEKQVARAMTTTSHFTRQLNVLMSRIAVSKSMRLPDELHEIEPPLGRVTLVFTDIENSTEKWETLPEAMQAVLQVHNDLVRKLMFEYRGYEVKTEGDAFMIAFEDPLSATRFCLHVQLALLDVDWPEEVLQQWPDCREGFDADGRRIWRGLRVRTAVHCGQPLSNFDAVTGRMDYFGPVVNKASRIVQMTAGGQLLISSDVWAEIRDEMADIQARELPPVELRGMAGPTVLVELMPAPLHGRCTEFSAPAATGASRSFKKALRALAKENEALKAHLGQLEAELKRLVAFSLELRADFPDFGETRPGESRPPWDSAQSMREMLGQMEARISEFRRDAEEIKQHIEELVRDKISLVNDRYDLMQRLVKAEAEKSAILVRLDRNRSPSPTFGAPMEAAEPAAERLLPRRSRSALLPGGGEPGSAPDVSHEACQRERRKLRKQIEELDEKLRVLRTAHPGSPPPARSAMPDRSRSLSKTALELKSFQFPVTTA